MKTLFVILVCALLAGCGSGSSAPAVERVVAVQAVYDYGTGNQQAIYDCGIKWGQYAYAGQYLTAAFSGYSSQVACAQNKGTYVNFWKY